MRDIETFFEIGIWRIWPHGRIRQMVAYRFPRDIRIDFTDSQPPMPRLRTAPASWGRLTSRMKSRKSHIANIEQIPLPCISTE